MSANLRSVALHTFEPADGQEDQCETMPQDAYESKGDELDVETRHPISVEAPTMSMTRMYLLAFGMMLTWFLGVSPKVATCTNDSQTASNVAVTILIPNVARDLEVTELEVQWVGHNRAPS